jgi:carbohydrate kinase (thermoresistant glucokinase family)
MSARVIILMGVSGSGKSTVGVRLAQRLKRDFAEGDNFHPSANVIKMASGIPLHDEDRGPWLEALGVWLDEELASGRKAVLACSALKRAYRDRLRRPDVRFVYLKVSEQELQRRVKRRTGHFMPPSLLESQLADLEPPATENDAITVDASNPDASVDAIIAALKAEKLKASS